MYIIYHCSLHQSNEIIFCHFSFPSDLYNNLSASGHFIIFNEIQLFKNLNSLRALTECARIRQTTFSEDRVGQIRMWAKNGRREYTKS